MRDLDLAEQVGRLPDDALVGTREVSALTGYSIHTIQQRRIPALPKPLRKLGRLKWRLGDLRAWIRDERTSSRV